LSELPSTPLTLSGGPLTIAELVEVARHGRQVAIGPSSREAINRARAVVDDVAGGADPVYGVNTGFGSLSQHRIAPADVEAIQRNIVRSHAAGVGDPLPVEVVRAMLIALSASLARGASGVQLDTVKALMTILNNGVTPIVPKVGSVGASGDLAPLAHAAQVLLGEGEVVVDGVRMSGETAVAKGHVEPVHLRAKEGLALLNGTHLMAGTCALSLHDAGNVLHAAVVAAAMAVDACRGSVGPFDDRIHALRPQASQRGIAAALCRLLDGSTIIPDHLNDDPRVQDPYSLRAAPQVIGAVADALGHSTSIIEAELSSITDNPLVVQGPDALELVSGANFHGMPLALAADSAITALCHLAGIAERRIFWVLSGHDPHTQVPDYLSPQPGLHSGLMIVQYTAAAACNELRALAYPASVGNISTSAGIEDYNSMGATSARRLRQAVQLTMNVIAMELLVMAEGLDHQRPLRSGDGVEAMHAAVRQRVEPLGADRSPAPDIAALAIAIGEGSLPIVGLEAS